MILKYIYTVFLGILLATFVGVGIAAFYPQPKYPQYPPMFAPQAVKPFSEAQNDSTQAALLQKQEQESYRISQDFQKLSEDYNKNVSVISLTSAIIILLLSLTLVKNLIYIADGTLLGGVLTLLYSIVRGFGSQDDMFRFVVVTIGLLIALILGYIKFIKPSTKR